LKPPPSFSPSETAVLVVDVQNDFVDEKGWVGLAGSDMRPLQNAVAGINRLIEGARESGAHVFYITVEHGPQVDTAPYRARYERRGMTPDKTLCHTGTWGAALYGKLASPKPDEPRLVKHGYDAFEIPSLADQLHRRGVRSVIVTGVVTELCVRSTAMSAFERGFFPVVPRESTASDEPEVAEEALTSLDRWYAEITSVDDVLERWRASIGSRSAS
jgi:ureidoacrylate peracid hydrolase